MTRSTPLHKARFVTRREALACGASALATPALLGVAGIARAQQKFTCRIAHTEGIGTPITMAFEQWTGILRERSGGRIDAQHFPAAQLGGLAQALEGSRIGTIQDEAHVDRVLQGPLGAECSEIARKKTGVEFVAYGETGFRHILSKRPVTSLDTLKGLKIRVPELRIWVDFWRRLGANPTPLPYSEQYSALSTGVIDGLDSDFFSVLGFKWHEHAKDMTLTAHWFLPKAVRVNARWLDSLPPDLRDMVRSSAKDVFAQQRATNRANAAKALADLEKLGVKVNRLADAERAKWAEVTAPLFDEFGAKSAETKAMIDKIRKLA
jgi:TRAP-type C4-dicarboxylate transport system substrate-binding protein